MFRSSHGRCSIEKGVSQNSQENTCARVSFLMKLQTSACMYIKKGILVRLFYCEFFFDISSNTFFTEHFRATVSEPFEWVERIKRNTEQYCKFKSNLLANSLRLYEAEAFFILFRLGGIPLVQKDLVLKHLNTLLCLQFKGRK